MNDAELCWIIVICMLFIYSSAPPPGSYSSVSRFLVAMLQTCLLYYYFITYLPLILISIYWYQFVIFFALSTPIAQFVIAISASKQTPIVTFFLRLVTTFAPPLLSFEFFFLEIWLKSNKYCFEQQHKAYFTSITKNRCVWILSTPTSYANNNFHFFPSHFISESKSNDQKSNICANFWIFYAHSEGVYNRCSLDYMFTWSYANKILIEDHRNVNICSHFE